MYKVFNGIKFYLLNLIIFLFLNFGIQSQEFIQIPPLTGTVVDLTNTLSAEAIQKLENTIISLQKEKGSQIQVLLIPTTNPEAIEQYSIRVAEKWKIGRKKIDDGVILIIAKDDRRLRIEVGYGLEGAIPDAIASRVINEKIKPNFKEGNFEKGVQEGVESIANLIRGEQLPEHKESDYSTSFSKDSSDKKPFGFWEWLIFVIGTIICFVFCLSDKPLLAFLSLYVLFSAATILSGNPIMDTLIISLFVSGFITVVFYGMADGTSSGGSGYSSSSGSSWSSSSSSSSGSSWSGGGGSFGGGGSSGSW